MGVSEVMAVASKCWRRNMLFELKNNGENKKTADEPNCPRVVSATAALLAHINTRLSASSASFFTSCTFSLHSTPVQAFSTECRQSRHSLHASDLQMHPLLHSWEHEEEFLQNLPTTYRKARRDHVSATSLNCKTLRARRSPGLVQAPLTSRGSGKCCRAVNQCNLVHSLSMQRVYVPHHPYLLVEARYHAMPFLCTPTDIASNRGFGFKLQASFLLSTRSNTASSSVDSPLRSTLIIKRGSRLQKHPSNVQTAHFP
ncbi:unnamed protein product [Somion occarium]|uniref:Uncharacterized protein n=1 Tax=Somion occarium TaxID=3059160 RepID=A0ABP1DWG0_9APHY